MLLVSFTVLSLGFLLLWKGSEWLIDAATQIALALSIPAYIIGFTVLAFGTSLPELIVNILASLKAHNDLVIGNIIGSNISNLLLILGFTGILLGCRFTFKSFHKKLSQSILAHCIFIGILLVSIVLFKTVQITGLMALPLLSYLFYLLVFHIKQENPSNSRKKLNIRDICFLFLGFIALFLGGKWVVDSATDIAAYLGLSQAFIALFLVALGTSLPELATSITGLRKGQQDLVLGNIFGSNIFNIAFVLPLSAWIRSIQVPNFILIDVAVLFIAHLLFIVTWPLLKFKSSRPYWLCIVCCYILYIILITLRG